MLFGHSYEFRVRLFTFCEVVPEPCGCRVMKLGSYLLTAHCLPPPRLPSYWSWCGRTPNTYKPATVLNSLLWDWWVQGSTGEAERTCPTAWVPLLRTSTVAGGDSLALPGREVRGCSCPPAPAGAAFDTKQRQQTALWHYSAGLSNM